MEDYRKIAIELGQTLISKAPETREDVERMLPELKESKDDRIRKRLTEYFGGYYDGFATDRNPVNVYWEGLEVKEVLAWLEKQSTPQVRTGLEWVNTIDDACDKRYSEEYAHGEYCHEQSFKWGFQEGVDWLEKQGEQKPCMIQWKGDNLKEVIGFTGKDKNFEKWFTSFEEYEKYVHEHNDIFKLFNEDGSHYEVPVGAWIVKTPDGYNVASKAVLKQKTIDKVKPKFHEGEWVILTAGELSTTLQIVKVDTDKKLYWFNDSSYLPIVDEECLHLWTIQDAKDGDVLACNNGWTCIFKTLVNDETFSSYCFMDNTKWFCETGSECHTLKEEFVKAYNGKLYPATKEQRDTLEKAMTDAGYAFDFKKKELKKIDHKELTDFQEGLRGILIESNGKYDDNTVLRLSEQVLELVGQKPAWSEEDENLLELSFENLTELKDRYGEDYGKVGKCINWLKSLKQRYTWKPSDEQMKVLENVRKILHTNDIYSKANHLMYNFEELIRTLNKLRGK